jgi:hypothetical protein
VASCQEVLDATDDSTGVTTTLPDTTANFDQQSTPTATASTPSPEFSSVITLINNSGLPHFLPPTDVSVVDTYGKYYNLGTTTGGRWVHSNGTVDREQYNGQSILVPGETISFDVIGTVPTIAQTPNIKCQATVSG